MIYLSANTNYGIKKKTQIVSKYFFIEKVFVILNKYFDLAYHAETISTWMTAIQPKCPFRFFLRKISMLTLSGGKT